MHTYYVIVKDGLYYNDIAATYVEFEPMGCLFPAHSIDHIWNKYLWPDQREGAVVLATTITITENVYTPKPYTDEDIKIDLANQYNNIGF